MNTASHLAEFFSGSIDEVQLIERCQSAGIDDLAFVRLCAAMKMIGRQEDERARELLGKSVGEPRDRWSADIARALLARLEADSKWPHGAGTSK